MPASPFQASGETSPGKNDDLPRTIAGSTPLPLGRRSFAVSGPLAPVRSASYPVPVRRLTGSFHASFSVRLTTNALRFPSVPATRFREDFHLQVIAHAGPTTRKRGRDDSRPAPFSFGELGVAYCTALIMSKMGRYMATIMPPTTTPSTTIMIGSIALSSTSTAASTSSS